MIYQESCNMDINLVCQAYVPQENNDLIPLYALEFFQHLLKFPNLYFVQRGVQVNFKSNTCAFISFLNNNIVLSKNVNSKNIYKKKVW
jgi:hypothetical protein